MHEDQLNISLRDKKQKKKSIPRIIFLESQYLLKIKKSITFNSTPVSIRRRFNVHTTSITLKRRRVRTGTILFVLLSFFFLVLIGAHFGIKQILPLDPLSNFEMFLIQHRRIETRSYHFSICSPTSQFPEFESRPLPGSVIDNLYLYNLNSTQRKPEVCLLYTSPSPRDKRQSRMPSSA